MGKQETMISRVAAALEAKISGKEFVSFEDAARAAIQAMREPTDAMRRAWDNDWQKWLDHHIEDDDHLYKVMIDAALNEESGE